jgi:polysaccharide biosynthesis/export protein
MNTVQTSAAPTRTAKSARALLSLIIGLSMPATFGLQAAERAPAKATAAAATAPDAKRAPLLALGVGDAVSVQVYGRPELSITTYVGDDGSIPVPLAGNVPVIGLAPAQAAEKIAAAFRQRQLLVDPQVTVFLVESRSQQVSVLGAVRSPGRYGVESTTTVLDVLAQAGGIADNGGTTVVVMRPDSTGALTRHVADLHGLGDSERALPMLTLRGGDSVFVPAAEQFSIYGEVGAPNIYRLDPGMTVVEAITRGGGVTPRGSRSRVEIRRAKADGSFETRSAALDDRVEANDVIRVKERLF